MRTYNRHKGLTWNDDVSPMLSSSISSLSNLAMIAAMTYGGAGGMNGLMTMNMLGSLLDNKDQAVSSEDEFLKRRQLLGGQ